MILCVYCSERATIRVVAGDWRRFSCAKHFPAVREQAQALRRNYTATKSTGFGDNGLALGARAVRRPRVLEGDGPSPAALERAAVRRQNAPRPLAKDLQRAFDRLVARRGVTGAALDLALGEAAVEKLRFGGLGRPDTVAKVETALLAQRRHADAVARERGDL